MMAAVARAELASRMALGSGPALTQKGAVAGMGGLWAAIAAIALTPSAAVLTWAMETAIQ